MTRPSRWTSHSTRPPYSLAESPSAMWTVPNAFLASVISSAIRAAGLRPMPISPMLSGGLQHELEDLAAALEDHRVRRDDEVAVGRGTRCVLFRFHVAALIRIAHQVVVRRRLGEGGEGGRLARGQL